MFSLQCKQEVRCILSIRFNEKMDFVQLAKEMVGCDDVVDTQEHSLLCVMANKMQVPLRVHELLMQLTLPARIAIVVQCCLFVPPLILPFSIWAIVLWDKRRRNV